VIGTCIVYVCSPDRYRQLSYSLSTLLRSGTTFDRIVVFCVGADPSWTFDDARIEVRPVSPLYADYFYGNKLLLCGVEADRVVFLDTDTLVFSPIDRVWTGRGADVLARVASAYDTPEWNRDAWREACSRFGDHVVPMYNGGFVIFQNGAHRRAGPDWKRAMELYRSRELVAPFDERMSDQYGLSLAMLAGRMSCDEMGRRHHTFGWLDPDVSRETVVFHTANPLFDWYIGQFRIPEPRIAANPEQRG